MFVPVSEIPTIEVAAGVLRDAAGRVLLAQRLPGRHLAGLWEFPGGKVEPDEAAEDALKRELAEELGIRIGPARPLVSVLHEYPEKKIRLMLFEVHGFDGEPHGAEGQPLAWVRPDEMHALDMPAADRPLIRLLELDGYYAISPSPAALGGPEPFLDAWRSCLEAGYRLLRLSPGPDERIDDGLIERIAELTRTAGARWIASGPLERCFGWPADGLHLDARQLVTLEQRPWPDDRLVLASCHDLEEIRIAADLGLDLVTLSPVSHSASHPDSIPLGWDDFERLVRYAPLPVMAHGGVTPADWQRARGLGAFGVAGMRGFNWT